jgi:peptidoglycan hydrolase-like protein with peptidoglycan-binding domain
MITLLATAALAVPAFAANNAANQAQQPTMRQHANQPQSQAQPQNTQQQQQAQQNGNQQIAPQHLSRTDLRQMQAALNKHGFNVGRPDGKLGPKTRRAVRAFNQKKGIQGNNGRPTNQTLAALGVNPNQNQQQNENQQQPSGSGQ